MSNDLRTLVNGDLDIDNGVTIAPERSRDRNIIITRIMTILGEVANLPILGISDRYFGNNLNSSMIAELTNDILRALAVDIGIRDTRPIVRVLPIRRNSMFGFVQPQKDYNDGVESSTIMGDFWTRNETITLLDGTEG